MSKNVKEAIKEIETFASDFEYLLSLGAIMSAYEHLQENQNLKELETMYYSLKRQGITRKKFIDLLCEKVDNGELKIPFLRDRDTMVQVKSLVEHYFQDLKKYNDQRASCATDYIKESEELFELIASSSKASDVKVTNSGIKGFFSKKEKNNSQDDETEQLIIKKKESLKNAKKSYNEINDIVEFLLDLQQMYPQYITLLSIEEQLSNLYSKNDIPWSFPDGYEFVKGRPDRVLQKMQEIIKNMNIPTGALLEQNSSLKSYVGKVNDMFSYFKISIRGSQLISYDEFLSNPEFVECINFLVEHINSIFEKEKNKKNKR